jgi:hypothetical protein
VVLFDIPHAFLWKLRGEGDAMKHWPRLLRSIVGERTVVFVYPNDDGSVGSSLLRCHLGEGSQNDQIPRGVVVSRGSVDTNCATSARSLEGIRHEPRASSHVPNVNGLVRKDLGRIQEVCIDGDAAFVV